MARCCLFGDASIGILFQILTKTISRSQFSMNVSLSSFLFLFLYLLSLVQGEAIPGGRNGLYRDKHCLCDADVDSISARWLSIFAILDPAVVDQTVTDDITIVDNTLNFIFFSAWQVPVSCVSLRVCHGCPCTVFNMTTPSPSITIRNSLTTLRPRSLNNLM
jgi:hypothetical protein